MSDPDTRAEPCDGSSTTANVKMLTDDPPKVSCCSTWTVSHLSSWPLLVSSNAFVCPAGGVVVVVAAVVVVGVVVTGTVGGVEAGIVVGGNVVTTIGNVVAGT